MSTDSRSRIMRAIRQKDTKPEHSIRRMLHGMGYRFRLHRKDLPGTPDIVLPRYRTAILVHGCFWHQHPGCPKGSSPRSRTGYWLPKLARNVERDREAHAALEALGELADLEAVRARLAGALFRGEATS
jgi:DNA mismatch endonuclease, patch repair protein